MVSWLSTTLRETLGRWGALANTAQPPGDDGIDDGIDEGTTPCAPPSRSTPLVLQPPRARSVNMHELTAKGDRLMREGCCELARNEYRSLNGRFPREQVPLIKLIAAYTVSKQSVAASKVRDSLVALIPESESRCRAWFRELCVDREPLPSYRAMGLTLQDVVQMSGIADLPRGRQVSLLKHPELQSLLGNLAQRPEKVDDLKAWLRLGEGAWSDKELRAVLASASAQGCVALLQMQVPGSMGDELVGHLRTEALQHDDAGLLSILLREKLHAVDAMYSSAVGTHITLLQEALAWPEASRQRLRKVDCIVKAGARGDLRDERSSLPSPICLSMGLGRKFVETVLRSEMLVHKGGQSAPLLHAVHQQLVEYIPLILFGGALEATAQSAQCSSLAVAMELGFEPEKHAIQTFARAVAALPRLRQATLGAAEVAFVEALLPLDEAAQTVVLSFTGNIFPATRQAGQALWIRWPVLVEIAQAISVDDAHIVVAHLGLEDNLDKSMTALELSAKMAKSSRGAVLWFLQEKKLSSCSVDNKLNIMASLTPVSVLRMEPLLETIVATPALSSFTGEQIQQVVQICADLVANDISPVGVLKQIDKLANYSSLVSWQADQLHRLRANSELMKATSRARRASDPVACPLDVEGMLAKPLKELAVTSLVAMSCAIADDDPAAADNDAKQARAWAQLAGPESAAAILEQAQQAQKAGTPAGMPSSFKKLARDRYPDKVSEDQKAVAAAYATLMNSLKDSLGRKDYAKRVGKALKICI